jgi:hypothetical protein
LGRYPLLPLQDINQTAATHLRAVDLEEMGEEEVEVAHA